MAVHRRARRWWRHPSMLAGVLALVVLALVLGSVVIVVKVGPPLRATLRPLVGDHVLAAPRPVVAWPSVGEGAIAIPSSAVLLRSPSQTSVPIGSVAKMMTALQVLTDHPLAPGEDGPLVAVTAADVAAWHAELGSDQSNVPIALGEQLTERQLLEGLLVHSGNDFAQILAEFDAGSFEAFVAKLNQRAGRMGLVATHYADASGYDPGTTSTPAEQLVVATKAMADPTFASIVAMPAVTLPVAGVMTSYTPLDGTSSVVGVKSGLTTQAAGCDVLALDASISGHHVLILSAVTGQGGPDRLADAGAAALRLAHEAAASFVDVTVATSHAPVGTLGWGHGSIPVVVHAPLELPVWPRRAVTVTVSVPRALTATISPGDEVGFLTARSGSVSVREPIFAGGTIAPPTLVERVV